MVWYNPLSWGKEYEAEKDDRATETNDSTSKGLDSKLKENIKDLRNLLMYCASIRTADKDTRNQRVHRGFAYH